MSAIKIISFIMVFRVVWLSAAMIDDMEDGDYTNEASFNWYYFVNACDSEITVPNAIVDNQGRLGMLPVAGIGYDEGYAAQLSWKINEKPAGCTYTRLASLVTSLSFDSDDGIGWEKATEISFYAKANAPVTTRVELTTAGTPNYGFFYKDVEVTTEWTKYTVHFSELVQYESAANVEFFCSAIIKLQFNIMADLEGIPDSGSLFIDDVEVNDTIIPGMATLFEIIPSEPGKVNELQGTLLSNFEGGNQGDLYAPEISNFKTPWYLFDDSEPAGFKNSVFTDGIQSDPEDSTNKLHINVGGKEGFDSTQGMKVSFKLGIPLRDSNAITQPFVGIGCMLSNSDKYRAGIDSSLKTTDASAATGIYFDYKTTATNEKFKHFFFELHDTDSLPDGMSFHIEIPATKGVWRSVTIPLSDLSFSNPERIDSLSSVQRSLDYHTIDKMQFKFQNIKETEIDVYFDNFKFVGNVIAPFGYAEKVMSSIHHKNHTSVSFLKSNHSLLITLQNLPAGIHTGDVELIGINGAVITREKIHTSANYSLFIKTNRLSTGVYILRVTTMYGNDKKHSLTKRIPFVN